MVKAELSYNPYLLETVVKFNGSAPKINSLVEKHLDDTLQKWMDKIPGIFYDEMNGFGFDLEFTGTTTDFETLQAVFDAQRISRDSVRILHKNELEDAWKKSERLSALLDWLQGNPNHRFDYPAFRQAQTDLFDTDYAFVVMQGAPQEIPFPDVVVENVSSAEELAQTDLQNTPILFCVTAQSRAAFKQNLQALLHFEDINHEQLFFLFEQFPDRFRVERFILDSGIQKPQFVSSQDDAQIRRYLALYPMTAYIRQAVAAFRQQEELLQGILHEENERSIQTNGDLHEKIDALDQSIQLLKNAHERILQRDNYHCPDALLAAKADCLGKLQIWRKKKIKITDDAEAAKAANDFEGEASVAFEAFIAQVQAIFSAELESIHTVLREAYASAQYDDGFKTAEGCEIDPTAFSLPALVPVLLSLFMEQYVEPTDLLGGILKNLPGLPAAKPREPLRQVTYLYSEWRQHAVDLLSPVLDEAIKSMYASLSDFYMRAAADYLKHLDDLAQQQSHARSRAAAQLSDDEQKLHEDHMWFAAFREILREIERA